MKKLFIFIIAVAGFGVSSYAQSATATSTATIITPIAISKTLDMNFGNVSVNANLGTIELSPTSGRTVTGGASIAGATGTVTAASFNITGANNYTYTITLPSGATTLTHTNNTNTMTADTWTSSPTPTGTLNGSGAQTLTVGATLHVGASQLAGVYTSGTPFTVTVAYN